MSGGLSLPRIFLAQHETKDKKTKSPAAPSGSSLWSNYSRPQVKSSTTAQSEGKKKSKQAKKKSKVIEEEKNVDMLNPEPETKRVNFQWQLDIPIRPQTPLDNSLGSLMRDDVSEISPKAVRQAHHNSKADEDDELVSPCGTPAHTFFLEDEDGDDISRCQSRQNDSKDLKSDDLEEPVSPCETPFKDEFSVKKEEDPMNQQHIDSARSSNSALSTTNNEQTATQVQLTRPQNINFKLPEKRPMPLPVQKQSDLVSPRSSATTSSGSVSPVVSTFSPQLGEGVRRVSSLTTRTSIVSPLGLDTAYPKRSFVVPTLYDTIEEGVSRKPSVSEDIREPVSEQPEPRKSTEDAASRKSSVTLQNSDSGRIFHLEKTGSEEEIISRGSSETEQSADSSTGSDFTRKASISSSYSVVSSKSSYGSDAKEALAPPKHRELDVRSLKAYSIISPVSAGVFDDEHPQLRRVPTFKKRLTIKESKNKPLPAEPAIRIPPLLIRRAESEQRARKHNKQDAINRPRFLSTNPAQSDLDSLDEAFRRSGLTSDPIREMSPSLRQATQELEDQLSSMSLKSGYALVTSPRQPPPIPERRHTDNTVRYPYEFPPEKLRKKPAHASSVRVPRRRRSEEDMSKQPRPRAPERAKGHSLFKNETVKESPKRKASKNFFSSKSSPQADGSKKEMEASESPEPTSSRSSSRLSTQSQPVGEKASHALSSARSRKGGERNLRLRLPRLKTSQLLPPQISAPTNLSIVSEASSNPDLSSKVNLGDESGLTAEDKIRAAITGLDRLQPQEPSPAHRSAASAGTELDCFKGRSTASSILELDAHANQIPQLAAENILLKIMQNADTFKDLFTLATLNRAFYQVFKRHELDLMKGTLFRMSPAAWELREMSPPWEAEGHEAADIDMPVPDYTPNLYIRHYTRDLFTMVALKSLILVRCESFLRPDTVRALAGLDEARSIQVDEAFWRVWTFCRLFGCGKGREDDIAAQADWLNGGQLAKADSRGTSTALTYPFEVNGGLFDPPEGFGKGNVDGLNSRELFDMMEIWTCLGVLLQIFHGECKVARKFGVFDNSDIQEGEIAQEEAFLEEWTQYLLTLGPSAILAVISINPESTIDSMFERAQSLGWTKWTSPTQAQGGARRWFLREAVSRVYESQLLKQESVSGVASRSPGASAQVTRSPSPGHGLPSSEGSVRTQESDMSRQRQAGFALELRRRRRETQDPPEGNAAPAQARGFKDERPISNFSDVMNVLEGREPSEVPKVPSIPATFAMHNKVTSQTPVIPEVSVVPPPGSDPSETPAAASAPSESSASESAPEEPPVVEEKISQGRYPQHVEILDPVDRAMHRMVNELGFSEQDAKWALKITDTGESLDVDAAISLLAQQGAGQSGQLNRAASTNNDDMSFRTAAFKPTVTSDNVWRPVWRWA